MFSSKRIAYLCLFCFQGCLGQAAQSGGKPGDAPQCTFEPQYYWDSDSVSGELPGGSVGVATLGQGGATGFLALLQDRVVLAGRPPDGRFPDAPLAQLRVLDLRLPGRLGKVLLSPEGIAEGCRVSARPRGLGAIIHGARVDVGADWKFELRDAAGRTALAF